MKICYIGNFTQRHCTEVHLAATLEDLGHSVTRIQESPDNEPNLIETIKGHDLLLFTRTWNNLLTLDHLRQLKELGIKTASYHLDLYIGLQRQTGLDNDPFWRTDFVFSPDGDPISQRAFESKGINHFYMKPGVYKPECYIAQSQKSLDVVFVGGGARPGELGAYGHPEWNYRNELIAWLVDTYKERFHKFGHPQETIRNEALNQLYADAKVVVGDSVGLIGHSHYWSDRVYETLGRGGFIIHPYIKGMDEEFHDKVHLRYYQYGNWRQLKELIDYYLEHDDERLRIRDTGHEFVKRNATYHNRLQQMLEIIDA